MRASRYKEESDNLKEELEEATATLKKRDREILRLKVKLRNVGVKVKPSGDDNVDNLTRVRLNLRVCGGKPLTLEFNEGIPVHPCLM